MNKTIFSLKYNLNQIITSKYLVQGFYSKYFISKFFFSNWKKCLVINIYSTQIVVISKIYKTLFLIGLLKRGCSLISDYFIYKNSNLHSYFYKGLNLKVSTTQLVTKFLNRLNFFFNKKENFILYKIKRGGYFGLARGLKCFLPSEHFLLYFSSFIVHKTCIVFNFAYNPSILKGYFKSANFSIVGGFTYNFNKFKNKRRRLFLGSQLTLVSFSYFSFLHFWLKKFKFSEVKKIKNKFIFKSFIKKFN
jgi:hypothetical protein